jgi:hypothetical protein
MEEEPDPISLFTREFAGIDAIIIALLLVLAIALVLAYALLKAGKLPPPAALVTALSLLTLLAIAGGIATTNDEAWAIAAAGIGALAGSVTNVYQATMDAATRRDVSMDTPVPQPMGEQEYEPEEVHLGFTHFEDVTPEPPDWDEDRK